MVELCGVPLTALATSDTAFHESLAFTGRAWRNPGNFLLEKHDEMLAPAPIAERYARKS
jgi:hypothetical protein